MTQLQDDIPSWEFSQGTARYRDLSNGQFISPATLQGWRDTFTNAQSDQAHELAASLTTGSISKSAWDSEMRTLIEQTHGTQYAVGRGGLNAMGDSDWTKVTNLIDNQMGYFDNFSAAVSADDLSEAQIAARADMYIGAGTQAYERGNAATHGEPDLPAYPADGSTQCLSACRCAWDLAETEDGWDCTWLSLDDGGTCEDCLQNGQEWAPLFIPFDDSGSGG